MLSNNKILPLHFNKNERNKIKCCICYENKKKYVKCSNNKCSDGIICTKCFKQLTPKQKEKCPICSFKININVKKNKCFKNDCLKLNCLKLNCCLKKIKILLISTLIIISSYIIGFSLFIFMNPNDITNILKFENSIVLIIIGSIINTIILFCCISIKRSYNQIY
jgi:hypothetical protein